jgi:hypothetical protein
LRWLWGVFALCGENAGRSVTYTTGETATFAMPGADRGGEDFIVLVQKGTLGRPGAIAASKNGYVYVP